MESFTLKIETINDFHRCLKELHIKHYNIIVVSVS